MWIFMMIVVAMAQTELPLPLIKEQPRVSHQTQQPHKLPQPRMRQPLFSIYQPRRYLDIMSRMPTVNVRKPVQQAFWQPDFGIDQNLMRQNLKSKIQDFRYDDVEAQKRLSPFANRKDRPSEQNVIVVYNSSGVGISQGVGSAVGIYNSSKAGVGIGGASIVNKPDLESPKKRSIVVVVNSNGVAVAEGAGSAVGVADSPETGIGIGGSSIVNTKKTKKKQEWQVTQTAPVIYYNGQTISAPDKPSVGQTYSSSQPQKIVQSEISTKIENNQ